MPPNGKPLLLPTDATSSTSALGLDRQNQQPSTGLTALAAAEAPELATSMYSERPRSSATNQKRSCRVPNETEMSERPSSSVGQTRRLSGVECHVPCRWCSVHSMAGVRAPNSRVPLSWQARSMASTLSNCTWQKLLSLPVAQGDCSEKDG